LARSTRTFAMPIAGPRRALRSATKAFSAGGLALAIAATLPAAAARADQPKTVAEAQAQMDFLDNQAEMASEQFNAAQARLATAKRTAQAAATAAGKAKAVLAAERAQVGAFAAATYKSGGVSQTLSVVLGGGDATQSFQKIATLQHLSNQQSQVLLIARVADLRYQQYVKSATQATAAANALAVGIAKQQQHIEALLAQSRQVLARLSAQQRAQLLAAQQAKLAVEQAAASKALTALRRTQAAQVASRNAVRAAKPMAAAPLAAAPLAVALPQFANGSTIAQRAVAAAMSRLGKRYVYGAGGPNTFDCSGLVQWSYRQAGVGTAHYTGSFWSSYRHVPTSQLQPGDLVFFYGDHHHVGIYLGGGMMVNAPHTGDVVRVAPAFGGDYVGAVRVIG
jgi:peptidoglycan DL-endopeptidase CwlO